MQIVHQLADLRATIRAARHAAGPTSTVGFAPTMGFLHDGHASLFRAAAADNDIAVASVYVNPTQFGPNEDLSRYPRNPEGDARLAEASGIDILWMPDDATMYPPGHRTRVRVSDLTDGLCGASRPGHFDGVTTIVAKLFGAVGPDRAYFGQKDYQQLAVIRQMTRDLDLPIEIIGMPTVREADGLARSSRNVYLKPGEREQALALQRALQATLARWTQGNREVAVLADTLRKTIEAAGLRVDYAEVVDPDTLKAPDDGILAGERAVALVAAFVGTTRLIDNHELHRPWIG